MCGSSPLARGLHQVPGSLHRDSRIIPAHAGLTRRWGFLRAAGADHPRSRGVYPEHDLEVAASLGSSPLARGLRADLEGRVERVRIIPARAGFTRAGRSSGPWGPDHPRSRGVYSRGSKFGSVGTGSSPLARGLRTATAPQPSFLRIIPARAGFTAFSKAPSAAAADHPRSRGVYGRTSSTAS